jgi:hypothetical protein
MSISKRISFSIRLMILGFVIVIGIISIIASGPSTQSTYSPPSRTYVSITYKAEYQISLIKVERPEKASARYGLQKVDAVTADDKYKYSFEDDMVKILWFVGSRQIGFLIQNKTDYSVKIPWDEAAFVDESGRSHRVMHSGVKYTDRDKSQPPSVIVRKGSIEDIVFPTDYVSWESGSRYSAGSWDERPLFLNNDYHGEYSKGKYSSFNDFKKAVQNNIGKQIQVLLPLQIQDVVNDYIFTFNVDAVTASTDNPIVPDNSATDAILGKNPKQ